jgi:hypothetical protein
MIHGRGGIVGGWMIDVEGWLMMDVEVEIVMDGGSKHKEAREE